MQAKLKTISVFSSSTVETHNHIPADTFLDTAEKANSPVK